MECPYLLLDAGGTLLFPDQELIANVAASEGSVLDPERVYEAHFRMLHQYDSHYRAVSAFPPFSMRSFYRDILMLAGAPEEIAERAVDTLMVRHEEISLWTYTKPWVEETLAALKRSGVRMAVISNSDGRVFQQLDACGITPYMEAIFDSHLVGFEKPDRRFFDHALKELGLDPAQAVYVGDFFHLDVLGANGAGIGALHLDPIGAYTDWPGVHLRDIRALPECLASVVHHPAGFDLFPRL
ncbi:MAG: HAD-IA family hydrolase [FCB group bacterium]|jgi:putative hydrolase of the HAD superfamily|nr:HAD-IA family hydrolase [FCB group bacterium]